MGNGSSVRVPPDACCVLRLAVKSPAYTPKPDKNILIYLFMYSWRRAMWWLAQGEVRARSNKSNWNATRERVIITTLPPRTFSALPPAEKFRQNNWMKIEKSPGIPENANIFFNFLQVLKNHRFSEIFEEHFEAFYGVRWVRVPGPSTVHGATPPPHIDKKFAWWTLPLPFPSTPPLPHEDGVDHRAVEWLFGIPLPCFLLPRTYLTCTRNLEISNPAISIYLFVYMVFHKAGKI